MRPAFTCQRRLLAGLFSLFITSFVLADEQPCTIHDNGKFYDLNPLKSKADYQIKTRSGRTLSLNICQSVKTETFGLKDDGIQPSEIGGFIRLDHGDFSIGKFNTSLSIFDSRPRFVMSEGSRCKTASGSQPGDIRASSMVGFICDTSVPGFGYPQLLASLPPGDDDTACAFLIEWKTSYACPTYEGSGFWRFITTLIVVLLVLSMTYTILGTLYNRFILDLRGYDQIPQFSFESMKYHMREGFEWTKDMLGILCINFVDCPTGLNRYSPISSSHHPRTPNPVSHQAQVSGMVNDLEQGVSPAVDRTAFIRPRPSHNVPSTPTKPPLTNPVSHHTQTTQSLSFSQPSTPTPHHQPTTQSREGVTTPATPVSPSGTTTNTTGSNDREFILVDDDDVEEQKPHGDDADFPSAEQHQATSTTKVGVPEPDPEVRLV